jgi:hypothetical protein
MVRLDMPWTILRFGRLTEATGSETISTFVPPGTPMTLDRDDAAVAIVEALPRRHLGHQVVHIVDASLCREDDPLAGGRRGRGTQ